MKVWLIQNIIAPYRIRLFEEIAKTPGVDFKVVLLVKEMKNLPNWKYRPEDMSFPAVSIPGVNIRLGYERILCINPSIMQILIRDRPDIVICAGFSFATVMSLLYMLVFGKKYVIWMEGTQYTEEAISFWRVIFRKLLSRFSSAFIDAGTLSKEYLTSLLAKDHKVQFFTSYNCIETERFTPSGNGQATVEEIRKRFPPQNLLYVGQLVERKGVVQMLHAYKDLCAMTEKPTGLILIGQGPLESHTKDYAKMHKLKDVYLEGAVKYRDIPIYYWAADVFVILSIIDPNPLVLFEALAAGLPVICSERLGNAHDFVKDGENGYIVNPYDIADVADKMGRALSWDLEKRRKAFEYSKETIHKANYHDSAKAFIDACFAASCLTISRYKI